MPSEETRHVQEDYGVREEAKEFPMMIVLSFVYICNAKCPNCPYTNTDIREDYRDSAVMPDDVFKKIADEAGPHGAYLRFSGGGEPMLHPHAVELILYAKDKAAKVGVISNGSVYTEDSLRELIAARTDVLEFSVDAPDSETYARVRPGLDWQRLNHNVRAAVKIRDELGSSTRLVASVINQEGVDVEAAEAYWNGIVDKVQIRKYLTWGYIEDHSADPEPYLPPEERIPCPWLFERLNIDSRGNVTICGEDIAFNEAFANIRDRSIKEIWHGSEFRRWRELHLARRGHEIPICSSCPDWKYRSWQHNYWKVLRDAERKREATSESNG